MKTTSRFLAAGITFLGLLLFSCKNGGVSPGPFENLEIQFLSGFISANLEPVAPPDPILCQLVLLVRNNSSSASLQGLGIAEADVFLDSTNARLGAMSFSTTWDGQLGSGEEDTVRLFKVTSQTPIFAPPCEQFVYLNLLIRHQSSAAATMKIDSLLFTCAE
jgi:hypothetical protein